MAENIDAIAISRSTVAAGGPVEVGAILYVPEEVSIEDARTLVLLEKAAGISRAAADKARGDSAIAPRPSRTGQRAPARTRSQT